MNLKNLFKLSALMFVFFFVLSSFSYGQTTFYVDVVNGLDGYNGLSSNVVGGGVGPKQTITNAIAAASDGDIISVAYGNGNLYNENIVYTVLAAGPNKRLTFTSTGGTPNVVSFTLASDNTFAPNNYVTFAGPFLFTTGLTLTDGSIIGASNITVGGTVTRNSATPAFGSVDSQLNYTGTVDFVYVGGSDVVTGYEMVPASDVTTMGSLTTATGKVTLNTSKTMKGILLTGGVLAIGSGNTLTINGTNTHTVGGNVTGGTMAFSVAAGGAIVNGNFNLPTITATATAANTLALNTNQIVGAITAENKVLVTVPNAITVGAVTNNSQGAVALFAASAGAPATVASVNNTSSGSVTLNVPAAIALTVTGNVAQSSTGFVSIAPIAGAGVVNVGGTVTNNPSFTVNATTYNTGSNRGVIIFGDRAVTVTGLVTVAPQYAGATGDAVTSWTNTGEVRFLNTTAARVTTLSGGVTIDTKSTLTYGGTAGQTFSNNGNLLFAAAVNSNITIGGTVTISTNWPDVTNITAANNGDFNSTLRAAGVLTVGSLNVTSSTSTNGQHGNFLSGVGAGTTITNVTTTGAKGGYIIFGNEQVTVLGNVRNQRTVTGTHIQFGTAITGTLNISIAGNLENTGSSTTIFKYFDGGAVNNETFTVSGIVKVTGGTVKVDDAAALSGTGTFQLGGIELSGSGTLDLTGAGTSNMDVVIGGNAKFYGGTLDVNGAAGVTTNISAAACNVLAADRVLQLGGLVNEFSSTTTRTTFVAANTLLFIQPLTVVAAQTVTGNSTVTVWPGVLLVKNPTGLTPAVTFAGGNFRVLGHVAFATSQVKIDNVTLFIGGQLAPNNGTGNFYNHAGYVTNGQGFISMNNDIAGGTFGGAGTFENFEVDCAVSVTAAAGTGAFKKTFNLTNGNVLTPANVVFDNSVTYPLIVRNAGTFPAPGPTFTSMVDVLYIGIDKATSFELPGTATKLNNLTVATTNDGTAPLVAGQGAVICGVATTVNGTLTIYDGQALVIKGVTLTMKGATINLNNTGIISNVGAADQLVLANPTGTTINGTGWLPDIAIAVGSVGNKIVGAHGLVTTFLGTDDSFGGAAAPVADFDPTAAVASGSITFGAGAGDLDVAFGAGALSGTNIAGITTADAANILSISADLTSSGDIAHVAGTIVINSGFNWYYRGLAPNITGGALINGPGTLHFRVGATTLTCTGSAVTINAPVNINLGAAGTIFKLDDGAGLFSLTCTNDFTITKGTVQLGGAVNARNLTLTGKNFTVSANGSFNTIGIGVLRLNAATANVPMLWSFTGNTTLGNLRISNDVNMIEDANGPYTVTIQAAGSFLHDGGLYNFGSTSIQVNGTFNRTAGTYSPDATGYLIINNATFNQGATGFDIPYLQFGSASSVVGPTFGNAGVVNVTKALGIDVNPANPVVTKVSGVGKLTVANAAMVEFYDGGFDAAPAYGANIDLYLYNSIISAIDATVWPSTANLVQNLIVDNTADATLGLSRTVYAGMYLNAGTLDVTAAGKTLTIADNALIQVDGGKFVAASNIAFAGDNNTLKYVATAAYNSNGLEMPATVKDLLFTRLGNSFNALVTIPASCPITVTGNLTINNDLTLNATSPITLYGNLSIGKDPFTRATNPALTFNGAIIFAGDQNTTITLPATAGVTLGNLTINKTNSQNTIELLNGNLVMAAGAVIDFQSGLLKTTGNLYVQIDTPVLAGGTAAQGFTRNVVSGGLSHVVGLVRKTLKAGIIETFGRNEFPVGSLLAYCPVAITTMNPGGNVTLGVNVTAGYSTTAPDGFNGLPIINGVAVGSDIARYAQFHWSLKTDVSMGNTKFDLELTSPGFEDYDDLNNVRIIRRMGVLADATNSWTLQGTQYNNYVSSGIPTVTNVQTYQGLNTAGAIFTYGMKTRLTAVPFSSVTIGTVNGVLAPVTVSVAGHFASPTGSPLTYTASSTNGAVATVPATISGTDLVITGIGNGECDVVVRATDENHDFITATIHVIVNSLVGIDNNAVPTEFGLSQNYPNPFNPTTAIRYALPSESHVTIKVYNMLAQEVATLVNEVKSAGYHTINFNANGLASGRYIAVIKAGDFNKTIKMNLLK